jgi:hypothetical protein
MSAITFLLVCARRAFLHERFDRLDRELDVDQQLPGRLRSAS